MRWPCASRSSFASSATTTPCSATDEILRLDKTSDRLEAVGLSLAEAKTLLADLQNRLVAAQAGLLRRPPPPLPRLRPAPAEQGIRDHRLPHRLRRRPAGQPALFPLPLPSRGRQEDLQPADRAVHRAHRAGIALPGEQVGLADVVRADRRSAEGGPADRHDGQRLDDPQPPAQSRPALRRRPRDRAEPPSSTGARPTGRSCRIPEGPIVVGLDGGYVRNWDDRKNSFEVVVGKSVPEDRDNRYFGFVQSRRRQAEAPDLRGSARPGPADEPGPRLPDRRRRQPPSPGGRLFTLHRALSRLVPCDLRAIRVHTAPTARKVQ